ncbi:hypothetical protein [Pseudoalteromonas aurantia]|uniref:Uncharacterized protein n=1 Tax=Pseudoalteromonas aurantia 208 TaxID=1314867 RepID=A0ABR9EIN2_9GAMM|nr:hypothetical protein [Pseudoalteromonas aurantia]MBE0370844.1 hypothetical protein [Pseudoalteromonas aurantia 208]
MKQKRPKDIFMEEISVTCQRDRHLFFMLYRPKYVATLFGF